MSPPVIDLSRLRDIGSSLWDPIGLMPEGWTWRDDDAAGFEDEYDTTFRTPPHSFATVRPPLKSSTTW
ncbi:hypothetical protein J5277_25655 [Rhizobium sp. 16-449-1b]|uniref:hypothetical protein n=1 Tax=Rhizobium sp. 16-449-1b TaxID=2819989 RepID=UPI001ADCB88B|nr:hypothetical protein [Rhizobium sp. 16-449-1b]MBO9197506.1 hypothetical protein [Rhizobium sp. 16-449-1b]